MIFQRPKLGDTRLKKGFAFFPVTADNTTVWLQKYIVCQSYVRLESGWYDWHNDYFCDNKKHKI
jgi:hypothetical protein